MQGLHSSRRMLIAFVLAWLFAQAAVAAVVAVNPSHPTAAEPIFVQYNPGSAYYGGNVVDAAKTRIVFEGHRILVEMRVVEPFTCHPIVGVPQGFSAIELGKLPPGEYQIEARFINLPLDACPDVDEELMEAQASFTVEPLDVSDPLRPLADFSGVWWDPLQPGAAVMAQQQADGKLSVGWLTHKPDGSQVWYVLLDGRWTAPNEYSGVLGRTRDGPHPQIPEFSESAPPGIDIVGEMTLRLNLGYTGEYPPTRLVIHYSIDGSEGRRFLSQFHY